MKSLSRVGLGLTVVFGCLFIALVCEIYYLLWWKRRATGRRMQDEFTSSTGDFFYLWCWKKKRIKTRLSSLRSINLSCQENNGTSKSFDVGPPRFLFTIAEETKEDLESETGKSRKESRKLSDLMRNGDTPYMTPASSPAFFTPPLTPSAGFSHSRTSSNGVGYNPFYESSTDVEFSNIIKVSPPPKFKFLRDAEEKLQNKNSMKNIV